MLKVLAHTQVICT